MGRGPDRRGAFRGLGSDVNITIDPGFNEDARLYGEYYTGEITGWEVLSGSLSNPDRTRLNMGQAVQITSGGCGEQPPEKQPEEPKEPEKPKTPEEDVEDVMPDDNVEVDGDGNVNVDDKVKIDDKGNVNVNDKVQVDGKGNVKVGDDVDIGPGKGKAKGIDKGNGKAKGIEKGNGKAKGIVDEVKEKVRGDDDEDEDE
ncbi:hypothetical protein ACFQH6_13675 [Halobacteriaceae archaeon GCM10025711]